MSTEHNKSNEAIELLNLETNRVQYDDFMRRWIVDLTFEAVGHDQPYIVSLVSSNGSNWTSNGVRFNPRAEDAAEVELLEPVEEDDDNDIGWRYIEGNEKEIARIVDALEQPAFIERLAAVIKLERTE